MKKLSLLVVIDSRFRVLSKFLLAIAETVNGMVCNAYGV